MWGVSGEEPMFLFFICSVTPDTFYTSIIFPISPKQAAKRCAKYKWFILNAKSFFLFYIFVESKEKLFSLHSRKLLRIILLSAIVIFSPLALEYYFSLVQSTIKISAFCLGNVLFLPFSYGWKSHYLNEILFGKGSISFYLLLPICQSLGISF